MRISVLLSGWAVCLVLVSMAAPVATAQEPTSKVFLNDVPTPVFFNDGDSFRVLAGPLKDTRARLAGFNTLESFGPVHQWGGWDPKELYFVGKKGTLNARRGVWHCTSDMKRDGYGRILWVCPDLVIDQVGKGFAHVMIVGGDETNPMYLVAQQKAQKAGLGIWAKGVPDYILTSTHSAAEEWGKGKKPYNRLVSTRDGRSVEWEHNNVYQDCENVCYSEILFDSEKVREAVAALRQEPSLADIVKDYSDDQLDLVVRDFARFSSPGELQDESHHEALSAYLSAYLEAGRLGELERSDPVCMIYVDSRRRYGERKASCLKLE